MIDEIDAGKATDIEIVAKIEQYLNERMRSFQKLRHPDYFIRMSFLDEE
jgi:hypothetical protein